MGQAQLPAGALCRLGGGAGADVLASLLAGLLGRPMWQRLSGGTCSWGLSACRCRGKAGRPSRIHPLRSHCRPCTHR